MNIGWGAPNGNGGLSHRPNLEQYIDNFRKLAGEMNLSRLDHYVAWKRLEESDSETCQRFVSDGTPPLGRRQSGGDLAGRESVVGYGA